MTTTEDGAVRCHRHNAVVAVARRHSVGVWYDMCVYVYLCLWKPSESQKLKQTHISVYRFGCVYGVLCVGSRAEAAAEAEAHIHFPPHCHQRGVS